MRFHLGKRCMRWRVIFFIKLLKWGNFSLSDFYQSLELFRSLKTVYQTFEVRPLRWCVISKQEKLLFFLVGFSFWEKATRNQSLKKIICLDRVLFKIITVTLFMMWFMWDKKVVENIKRWVRKCVYDANEILFDSTNISNNISFAS